MDTDTGKSPPVCQKTVYLTFKTLQLGSTRNRGTGTSWSYQKEYQPMGSPFVVVPKKSAHGETPRRRMCIDLRKLNEL